MKVIFLDIDGVLNSGNYIKRLDGQFDDPQYQMDPVAVARLNTITRLTGASIVVSSTWRLAFKHSADPVGQCQRCMSAYKIEAPVIGITGELPGGRKEEIREWLSEHSDVDAFVILDDDTIETEPWTAETKPSLIEHCIKTSFCDGLTRQSHSTGCKHSGTATL